VASARLLLTSGTGGLKPRPTAFNMSIVFALTQKKGNHNGLPLHNTGSNN